MSSYTLLSECLTRETHLLTGAPIRHHMWYLLIEDTCYYVSWLSLAPEGNQPECMAFECDERGQVDDWEELAVSYSPDPEVALSEILDQLLVGEAA